MPLTVAALLAATGCHPRSADYSSDVDTVEVAVDEADGLPVIDESTVLTDTVKAVTLGVSPRRFMTAAEAAGFMEESADAAAYRAGILPRMLDDCLEYADRLLNNTHDHFIIVDKASMNVILYDRFGREVKVYPMACGRNYGTKQAKADSRTPEGFFYARGIYDSTDWLFTDDNGVTSPKKGQFGPRFIRIYPQIGIHGTGSPWSLGKRVSHGCIRISNDNIMDLVGRVDAGTPVIVNPSARDMKVNKKEGREIPFVRTGYSGPVPEIEEEKPAADTVVALPAPEPVDSVTSVLSPATDTVSIETDTVETDSLSI